MKNFVFPMNVALKFSGHICGAIVGQESRPKGKQWIYLYVSVESLPIKGIADM